MIDRTQEPNPRKPGSKPGTSEPTIPKPKAPHDPIRKPVEG
jgi:hypothetical protein